MSIARIASRYAKSLFDLAKNEGKLDKVHQDILYVREVAELPDFSAVMKNPLISEEKKENIFRAVFGQKVDDLTLKTLMIMAEHNREAYLNDICLSFHVLYNEERHVSTVLISSAVELSSQTIDNILSEFKAKGIIESQVELKTKIDPSILGGFILQFKDKVYNASIAYKLDQLRNKFSENLYIKNF
jgi:F-type H+-transporting ATPase subunit delta